MLDRIGYLLGRERIDALQTAAQVSERQAANIWWLLEGKRKFPTLSNPLSEDERREIFEPLPGYAQIGELGINRIINCLVFYERDLQTKFNRSTGKGQIACTAWFYSIAVPRLGLAAYLDENTRTALLSPGLDNDASGPNRLMLMVWLSVPALQKKFDIVKPEDKAGLVRWFLEEDGVSQLGLTPLEINYAYMPQYLRNGLSDSLQFLRTETAFPVPVVKPVNRHGDVFKKNGVNLVGYAYGEMGIGEDLRMAAQCCKAAGIPYRILNVDPGPQHRQLDRSLEADVVESISDLPYKFNIYCMTAFETLKLYASHGKQLFHQRHNIGWWPWELPVWPRRWSGVFDIVEEVWAASTFTFDMYKQSSEKPVELVPLAVSVDKMARMTRKKLGLPPKKFLFLYIFDFNSYLDRKNPLAAIQAFQKAFPTQKDVGLVFKTMGVQTDSTAWQDFIAQCCKDARISVLQTTFGRDEVLALINACDAYVSLHRSEGFGRTIAEAVLLKKPVVATDFSGNKDFLTMESGFPVKCSSCSVKPGAYPYIDVEDSAWWAEPDIQDAAMQMIAARNQADSDWIQQLPQKMSNVFSSATIGAEMLAILRNRGLEHEAGGQGLQ